MFLPCLLTCNKNSNVMVIFIPLYITFLLFPLVTFMISSVLLVLSKLIMMSLGILSLIFLYLASIELLRSELQFSPNLDIFPSLSLPIFFCSPSLLSLEIPSTCIFWPVEAQWCSFVICLVFICLLFFFSECLMLNSFYCCVFKFTNLIPCNV